jgi:hypothetical protein
MDEQAILTDFPELRRECSTVRFPKNAAPDTRYSEERDAPARRGVYVARRRDR